ncbi:sulfatase-like hydrolase/transferase [Aneurinibacillus danicus]|uniref:Uncharacterized protein n=1 Tax=Aneurinibacillus danicus TaxID=267746 RepID=A0A511VAY7_9BACL|nr:sulfatase-like hydrolase/transferase [Aneurinibacillus danicus]GEN35078.1 hypothetical protein ADA01nite_25380 [Aneurinibacillus danicus]
MGGSGSGWPSPGRPNLTSDAVEIIEEQGHRNVIIIMADALGADYLYQYRKSASIEGVLAVNFDFLTREGVKISDCLGARPPHTETGIARMFFGRDIILDHTQEPFLQIERLVQDSSQDHLLKLAVQHNKFVFNLLPRSDSAWLTQINIPRQKRLDILLWESWKDQSNLLTNHSLEFKIEPNFPHLRKLKDQIKHSYPTDISQTPFVQLKNLSQWVHNTSLTVIKHLLKTEADGIFAFIHDPTLEFLGHWCGEQAYREGIIWTDEYLGRLIAQLREQGVYDNTLILLTADHGMTFRTKDQLGNHGDFYSRPEVKYVPFIFNKKVPISNVITSHASTLEVAKSWLENLEK